MSWMWPDTDVLDDVRVDAARTTATARTRIAYVGAREHVHSSSILLAGDVLLHELLEPGEAPHEIARVRCRRVVCRELELAVGVAPRGRRDVVMSASYVTDRGRTFHLEAVASGPRVVKSVPSPGVVLRMLDALEHASPREGVHRTRLSPVPEALGAERDSRRLRFAAVEWLIEATRAPIRDAFGPLGTDRLVLAQLEHLRFPTPEAFIARPTLEYRMTRDRLSSGTAVVHCDFSFAASPGAGRLTVARIPHARLVQARRAAVAAGERPLSTAVERVARR